MKPKEAFCGLRGLLSTKVDLREAAKLFSFVKEDDHFGGRLLITGENSTAWLYRSGNLTVLAQNELVATKAYDALVEALGEATSPVVFNRLYVHKANKRVSLKKLARRVPSAVFIRKQRTTSYRVGGTSCQTYGSGVTLVRTSQEILVGEWEELEKISALGL